jgi:hypothetical protein
MSCSRPLAFAALTTAALRFHAAAQCIHQINALGESAPARRVETDYPKNNCCFGRLRKAPIGGWMGYIMTKESTAEAALETVAPS